LHGDDSELIFFIDPYQEVFLVIMEDTSAIGPVSVESASIEESITFLEEIVISNELVLIFLAHTLQWVVLTLELTSHLGEYSGDE